ncbi:Holliday junction resolvase RuvX [Lutibaculum baratangense]|uniref:Putative pre-16S rRNA nuclease n=1 Tax=Lutibaculum baratangense AMV1 TaxID=631454 RepID=V4RK20_9HYPH|nr:Holliday junction resolvase RuvX [Lutibaculum baratangense]ESR23605.1 Holliday junction resolvase YqgF [Lutibaculum baratangense AMV1]
MMLVTTDIAEFCAALPARGALFGLDPGSKTIGIAVCDAQWRIASPLLGLRKAKFSRNGAEIADLVSRNGVKGLVVGLPLNMDGTTGPSAQAARSFARNLAGLLDLPVLLWDERLTTAAVTRGMIEADTSRRKRAEIVDKIAASYILQGALDAIAARRAD